MNRPVKEFCVMARTPDGKTHEITVMASCFQMAEGEAIRALPDGASVFYIATEQ